MSSDPEITDPPASESRELQDLVLNLNFVPTWARQPAEKNPYENERGPRPERRDDRRDGPRRDGPGGGRDRKPRFARSDRRPDRRGDRRDERRELRPERLPVEVSFIPEKNQLGAIVRQLNGSCKAYPLYYVAHLLLAKPEYHVVKIEVAPGAAMKLFRCTKDGIVALDQDTLRGHILKKFLPEYFEAQEIETEPPAGNFVVVGRCRLSGELLGPPNYHNFNEKVLQLHRERYPHMALNEYRAQVEMTRDPALIEQWKDQSRRQTVFKPVGSAPDAPTLKRNEAEAKFWADHGSKMIETTSRALMSATTAREIDNEALRSAIYEAWSRESRNPFKMSLALRPAFRRMHLHMFKAGGRETFVTAVPPKPIEPSRTIDAIGNVLRLLEQNPGCTRAQLTEMLCPGEAPDSPVVIEALAPLRWLVEKGHVIEFFNGTLSVPAPGSRDPRSRLQKSDLDNPL